MGSRHFDLTFMNIHSSITASFVDTMENALLYIKHSSITEQMWGSIVQCVIPDRCDHDFFLHRRLQLENRFAYAAACGALLPEEKSVIMTQNGGDE